MTEERGGNDVLGKGALVSISGLKSAAGSKLNGSHGLVLGKPLVGDNNIKRYPVWFFALVDPDTLEGRPVLMHPIRNKVKEGNLSPIVEPDENNNILDLFYQSSKSLIRAAHELGELDEVHYLTEQCHQRFPDDVELTMLWAMALVEKAKKYKKAAQVVEPIVKKLLASEEEEEETGFAVPWMFPDASTMHYKVSIMLAMAGPDHFQDALDCAAEKVTKASSGLKKQRTLHALQTLCGQCSQHQGNPVAADVLVKACQTMCGLDPKNRTLMQHLGAAHEIAGHYYESAKLHRKLLATMDPNMEDPNNNKVREGLVQTIVLAQLQCPEMPLANHQIVNHNGNEVICFEKVPGEEMVMRQPNGMMMMASTNPPIRYTLPTEMNDPAVFPECFLEQIQAEVQEELTELEEQE